MVILKDLSNEAIITISNFFVFIGTLMENIEGKAIDYDELKLYTRLTRKS